MRTNGIAPDKHTFPLLLKAFSKLENENPFQFYAHIVKFGLNFDQFVRNSLISAFSGCGYLESANQVFDESTHKDVVAWTAFIDGYVKNGRALEAIKCFLEMRLMGIRVDEVTVVSVLCAAGMAGDIWFGRCVHGFYVEAGRVQWDAYVGSALLDMYMKCGYHEDACKVFNEMPVKNVVCWSALIAGYTQCSKYKDALLALKYMLSESIRPNQSTFTSVLTSCAHLGALDRGKSVHGYICRHKIPVNSLLGTALVDMYAKCGCIDEALSVFGKLPTKDVFTWTAMIKWVLPNEVTFIGVLSACSHGGLVDEGRKLFGSMKQVFHLEPTVDHYGCMVDLLGRAGGTCRKSSDQAAVKSQWTIHTFVKLVLDWKKWEIAAGIRKLMKGKRVEKITGYSWIEVNGAIFEFAAFDKSHSESENIYLMLDNMFVQLKLAGYVPDTNLLAFDIDGS
ncbi:pentatricopeptide repeat-containing protein [Prunus yedoensis var. nudiflora]|uniref:Pentatricopeptide repeat-containing protein n=1 Tax=Prunus yedoensis var. nudiflora TaxID=2094558 RepID=A0A314YE16_PRUYE|nr:pentatricopeptide repeat-containing protein [Prunus yedoensis var. nudiflora]